MKSRLEIIFGLMLFWSAVAWLPTHNLALTAGVALVAGIVVTLCLGLCICAGRRA